MDALLSGIGDTSGDTREVEGAKILTLLGRAVAKLGYRAFLVGRRSLVRTQDGQQQL